ncbi:hypothetical protein FS749_008885 [Ceratobasidium sp. UAMH 11750]|nr:hypothetical protein FS749_008885 [Ceratobasidium sp. UAMH 11750]
MSTAPSHSFRPIHSASLKPEERSEAENRWVSFQPYLLSKGYQLRPRYQPDWVPSWKTTGANPYNCEDSANSLPLRVLDATRVDDQLQVIIKMIIPSSVDREGEEEVQILQHLSSSPYREDPTNHTVPCLDSFPIPDVEGGVFIVMPLLSTYTNPPFYNLSELHDFLDQVLEGLEFLHNNGVAHCDIAPANIMMDKHPLYDEPFHPYRQKFSLDVQRRIWPKYHRWQKAVRYYYIDFGYATWFRDSTSPRLLTGIRAREVAPEQRSGPYDPFKADIYQLGAMLRRDLIPKYEALGFLLPLARDMTDSDPNKRPTLQLAHRTVGTHFAGLPGWRTRWPLMPPNATFALRCRMTLRGVTAEVMVLLKKILSVLFLCS